jgi:hypothetical protein
MMSNLAVRDRYLYLIPWRAHSYASVIYNNDSRERQRERRERERLTVLCFLVRLFWRLFVFVSLARALTIILAHCLLAFYCRLPAKPPIIVLTHPGTYMKDYESCDIASFWSLENLHLDGFFFRPHLIIFTTVFFADNVEFVLKTEFDSFIKGELFQEPLGELLGEGIHAATNALALDHAHCTTECWATYVQQASLWQTASHGGRRERLPLASFLQRYYCVSWSHHSLFCMTASQIRYSIDISVCALSGDPRRYVSCLYSTHDRCVAFDQEQMQSGSAHRHSRSAFSIHHG